VPQISDAEAIGAEQCGEDVAIAVPHELGEVRRRVAL
jgi:hypothetical protein